MWTKLNMRMLSWHLHIVIVGNVAVELLLLFIHFNPMVDAENNLFFILHPKHLEHLSDKPSDWDKDSIPDLLPSQPGGWNAASVFLFGNVRLHHCLSMYLLSHPFAGYSQWGGWLSVFSAKKKISGYHREHHLRYRVPIFQSGLV